MSYASDQYSSQQGPWRGPRFGPGWNGPNGGADERGERFGPGPQAPWFAYRDPFRPAMIAMMIVGFIVAWPLGLVILGFMFWRSKMGCWNRADRWNNKMSRLQEKMDWMRGQMESRGFSGWGAAPSSGNRAFDEYRAETLRRLEDEQREFKDFLDRLRMAKDKSEFDQFMAERRSRPTPPAPRDEGEPHPAGA